MYYYSYKANGWVLYVPKNEEAACWTDGGINYKMYSDGTYWYPYQTMKSVTNSGSNIIVMGYTAPNTFIQLQLSTDNVNWGNEGTIMSGDKFQNVGATVVGMTVGKTYYFRFYLFDNNCNYGYSDSYRIVKS